MSNVVKVSVSELPSRYWASHICSPGQSRSPRPTLTGTRSWSWNPL